MTVTGGGGPLHLQEQVLVIAVTPAPAEHGTDVGVDGLDGSEGDLLVAVVEDTVEVSGEKPTQLLEGRQALPAQGLEPVGEKAAGRALVGVGPEAGELLRRSVIGLPRDRPLNQKSE